MAKPKLRFPEFTDEWEEKTFGDVFLSLEYGMNTAAMKYDGVNKYIRITDIDDISHRYLTDDIVSPSGELSDRYLVNENDILFARTGASTGKSYLYKHEDGKLYFAGFLIRGHVKSVYNSFFIFTQTLTGQYNKWVKIMSIRSGQPGINATEYALFKFMCPCIEEQEKIADFLSSVDDIIQIQEDEISTLEEQKKGAMQKLFNREVRFKADDGREYPEWEEKGLEQIANIFDGTLQTPEYVNEGIPFVSVEDIDNLYRTNKYITEEAFNKEFKIYPQQGDILMTRIGSIGVAAIITKDIKMAYYVSLALLKLKEKVNTEYLLQYILCEKFQQELWKRTLHIAFPKKINKNEIGKCKVNIPCLEEQQKIADCLSAYDEAIQIKKKKLEVWKDIKKGLLQQMFV